VNLESSDQHSGTQSLDERNTYTTIGLTPTTAVTDSTLASPEGRWMRANESIRFGLALAALCVGALAGQLLIGLIAASFVIAADLRHWFSLRNWILGYIYLLFAVGGRHYFPTDDWLLVDGFLYGMVFITGFHCLGLLTFRRGQSTQLRPEQRDLRFLSAVVIAILFARVAYTAWQAFIVYGIGPYVAGAALVDHITATRGTAAIPAYALGTLSLASIALYFRDSLITGRRPNSSLMAIVLIGVPILRLQRQEVIYGCISFLAAYLFQNRLHPGNRAINGVAVALLGIGLATGVGFGALRENALHPDVSSSAIPVEAQSLIFSELSPIVVYEDLKAAAGGVIPYQNGGTLIIPFILKLVPHEWVPNKPLNTGAFYAVLYYPQEFALGFASTPSIFGALYLNFGYFGCAFGIFLIGVLAARLDLIHKQRRVAEAGWLLISYSQVYLLLRSDPTDALTSIVLVAGCYGLLAWLVRPIRSVQLLNGS
jgi:oligosaccharide repeat unit polymerase